MKSNVQIIGENREWAIETLKKVDAKMSKVTVRSRDKLADGVDANGVHRTVNPRGWTSGFWGGLNAMMYDYTKAEEYLACARSNEALKIEPLYECFEKHYHDVGFRWHLLTGALYRITGEEQYRNRNTTAK